MLSKNCRRPLTLEHKIKLKKQLSKAFKKAGLSEEHWQPPAQSPQQQPDTSRRERPTHKPRTNTRSNSYALAIRKRQQQEHEREAAAQLRETEKKEKAARLAASSAKRHQQTLKLTSKNQRGQPNLNNQIEAILSRIQK